MYNGEQEERDVREKQIVWLNKGNAALKFEMACVKFQRDALLEMTWLDLPAEPNHESTKMWKRVFTDGWERKPESANVAHHPTEGALANEGWVHSPCWALLRRN